MRRTGITLTVALMLALVPVATPAWAHEGKLKLEVAGDGATGITVQAKHADGHQLEDMVRLVVTATSSTEQPVGPIQLEPAGEGQGFYLSGPILTPGDWRVTVRAPAPYTSESTVAVRARDAQTPPPPAAKAADPAGSESRWHWWLLGVGVLAAAGLATALARALRRGQP